ncbi:ABC transporter ATP-binding protein [Erysipelothrix larvae]|uniref:ABC transporter ATP-binding protein n=1 Tax=Erysipelothrix larvae TaxID=1514105 RepID=A0A109UH09_9FIRM|nr:ABC transporter ATP-binding protein [Erysipelothrix larvae]AMC93403.1 ABC transporter ATP-binding protein [Erysipelothrix larvae]
MLKIENLEVNYGSISAIKSISINVEEGQLVSLVGANGAGKSTLLKTISGLINAKSGSITFEGKNLSKVKPHDIVKMGIVHVPEGRRIFSGMTVEENLLLGAFTRSDHQAIKEELEVIYKRFPILGQRKNQDAHTLSGGEQQMLAISRALLSKPRLLLLDEPSMGLAPLIVKEIFNIIKETNNDGVTVLLVEQNAKKALEIADYAYIIENGVLRLEGKAEDIINSDQVKELYLGG